MQHLIVISPFPETSMLYAGDVRDYENVNAAMRNIDSDCNLFNIANSKYYLEDDINEVITINNLTEDQFSPMHLNI